jgi:hypothetical protein
MPTDPDPSKTQNTITVIVRQDETADQAGRERGGERGLTLLSEHMKAVARIPVPAAALQAGIEEFVESMRGAIAKVTTTIGEFRLDKVTLAAEVNAKGKLELLGTGGELGGKAGITFEFKRNA